LAQFTNSIEYPIKRPKARVPCGKIVKQENIILKEKRLQFDRVAKKDGKLYA
jgi:hypothetical protein